MADNVSITAGSGTSIGTDERTVNSVAVQVQRVDEQGATALAVDQLTPTSTATTATIAARDTRKRLVLVNQGTVDLYISDRATNAGTPATTTAKSIKVSPGASLTLNAQAAVYVFTASTSGTLHYVEEYDS